MQTCQHKTRDQQACVRASEESERARERESERADTDSIHASEESERAREQTLIASTQVRRTRESERADTDGRTLMGGLVLPSAPVPAHSHPEDGC